MTGPIRLCLMSRVNKCSSFRIAIMIAMLMTFSVAEAANAFRFMTKSSASAKADVSGYGFLENLDLEKTLRLLVVGEKAPEFYSANFIEDAALILRSKAGRDGYLIAKVTAVLTLADGSQESHQWTEDDTPLLPRSLQVRKVRFEIEKGLLFHYDTLRFIGLDSMSDESARSLFIESGGVLPLKQSRIYTSERLQSGLDNLVELLKRDGFENATATVLHLARDDRAGTVAAVLQIAEGKRSMVRAVRVEIANGSSRETMDDRNIQSGTPFSSLWLQDLIQELKQEHFRKGFPDTVVEVVPVNREDKGATIEVDLIATVTTGPNITVASVNFEGHLKSKTTVLQDRLSVGEGDTLDRIPVEQSRYRLARLGVFDSVDVRYEDVSPQSRDLVFELKEGKRVDMSFLSGYGSYELLQGGIELEQFNVLGRAHHAKLRSVQSFKASSVNYTYTMPELFGKDTDIFLNASGLSRQEISFKRQEFGGGAGARRYFEPIGSDVSARYTYEILNAIDTDFDLEESARNAGVASLITDIRRDRRDNPLSPHAGYKIFGNVELASKFLGGEVNYQRFELTSSYHRPLGTSRWLHLGASHGMIFTLSGTQQDVPFNRRFFPGGENSMRGLQQGEAAPRDANGRVVGAETYMGVNIELEQGLTPQWSVIGFVDAIGFARDIGNYPFDDLLLAVGGGIRWNTFIGPVRLEYGHNVNPRLHDPAGTVHFSIGFPF